jgi:hypothetical protein
MNHHVGLLAARVDAIKYAVEQFVNPLSRVRINCGLACNWKRRFFDDFS